jgi:hypothetical protein
MKLRPYKLAYLLIFFFSVSLLFGCNQKDSPSMVLLNNSTLPCWFDICPGITKKTDALQLLAMSPFVEEATISERSIDTPGNYADWTFEPEISDFGRVFFNDLSVSYIGIFPRPVSSLSFDSVVQKYGSPKYVWAYSDCADSRWLHLALIYPEQGLYVVSFDSDWKSEESASDLDDRSVSEVIFFDPAMLEDLLMNFQGVNWLGYGYTFDDLVNRLQPWESYSEANIVKNCY